MRHTRGAAIVLGLLTMFPAVCLATQGAAHATKGVVTFVNADTLVIARSPHDGRKMTFVLNPSTERVGTIEVGSTVDIRYHTEARQDVATAVTVVHATR